MKLSDYLQESCVPLLEGTTKLEALDELVRLLAEARVGPDTGSLREAVLQREKLMSTGIGNSLAIPHVRMPSVPKAKMAVGVSPGGLPDYESFDKRPVHIVVLIAAPQGQHDTYVRLLSMVADVLKELDLACLPVTAGESDGKLVGLLEQRAVSRFLSAELLRRRQLAEVGA